MSDRSVPARPIRNVLFILGDQHRRDCIGCYGNEVVRTPNIDRLAAGGVRFDHAYTPQAICTPARACIQTGQLPQNHGLIFNWEFQNRTGGELNLRPETRMFSQGLGEAGWQLAHLGKWHIGDVNKPADYGYEGPWYPGYGFPSTHEHYLDYLRGFSVDGFNIVDEIRHPARPWPIYGGVQEGPEEASVPHYLAEQTIEKIRTFSADGRPFFVSCNFWGPHTPYFIPRRYFEMYDPAEIEAWPNFDCDLSDKPRILRRAARMWGTDWMTRENLPGLIARLYGYVTLIDDQVGRLVRALDECGVLEETLIIYTADHGSSVGAYRMWDKGFGMYDCLTRIPMIFSHGSLAGGSRSDAFVNLLDLAPTFLEIAGVEPFEKFDGHSLGPVLRGDAEAVREDFMITQGYGHQVPFWQRMVRFRDAKYIFNAQDADEWYDTDADPWETRNIVEEMDARRLGETKDILREWIERTKDHAGYGWLRTL